MDQSDFRVGEQSPYSPLCATNLYQCKAAYQTIEDSSEKTIKQCNPLCVCLHYFAPSQPANEYTSKESFPHSSSRWCFKTGRASFSSSTHIYQRLQRLLLCLSNMSSISLTSWEGIMIQTYSTGWKPYRGQ